MISDITLGQFFPGFSIIHKLDPRMKIILAIFFIAAIFVANNPVSFADTIVPDTTYSRPCFFLGKEMLLLPFQMPQTPFR